MLVGDQHNKISDHSDTKTEHYTPKWTDPTLTVHLEIFGVGLWFTPAAMPSSLTATSAKLKPKDLR